MDAEIAVLKTPKPPLTGNIHIDSMREPMMRVERLKAIYNETSLIGDYFRERWDAETSEEYHTAACHAYDAVVLLCKAAEEVQTLMINRLKKISVASSEEKVPPS